MNLKCGWLLLLSISTGVWSVPIDRHEGNQEVKEEVQEESVVMVSVIYNVVWCVFTIWEFKNKLKFTTLLQDTGLYYDRYLREVIEVLETDPHFREKLQTANTEDIKVSVHLLFTFYK